MLRTTSISLTHKEMRRDRRYALPPVAVTLGDTQYRARNWSLGGLLLESAGLIAAAAVLILLSCWSRLLTRPGETLLLAAVLIALVAGIFVFGLGMPVDLY